VLLFLDTEFTHFDDPKLLSVGLVSETGDECEVQLLPGPDSWQREHCSGFVKAIVLPILDGPALPRAEARDAVIRFLRLMSCQGSLPLIITDFTGDWVLLRDLLEPLPEDLLGLEARLFSSPTIDHYAFGQRRHNALVDARALKWAYAQDLRDAAE
jgi:hypothetical protein